MSIESDIQDAIIDILRTDPALLAEAAAWGATDGAGHIFDTLTEGLNGPRNFGRMPFVEVETVGLEQVEDLTRVTQMQTANVTLRCHVKDFERDSSKIQNFADKVMLALLEQPEVSIKGRAYRHREEYEAPAEYDKPHWIANINMEIDIVLDPASRDIC